jgi:PqqD family protein of HPr-rel-A system
VVIQLVAPIKFSLPPASRLAWKSWDDSPDWIVYDVNTRDTHLLDELAAFVLKLLENGPQAQEELAAQLVREFDIEPAGQSDAMQYIANLLPRLRDLGLIEGVRL